MDLPHLAGLRLPRFRGVESILPQRVLDAPHLAIQAGIAALGLRPGLRIAVAVGSRGIAGLPALVAATVAAVCQAGCLPFIVPAMGSHGGATAEGQTAVLATLGVTAKSAGCPIRSHMETVEIATLDGLPIHVDRCAWTEADVILPLVRIKPHTGFRGRYESGICKMLAIGLGKHAAAARLHREGYGRFAELIPAVAAQILATGRIVGAIAVVENASDTLAVLDVIPAAQILAREPELLA